MKNKHFKIMRPKEFKYLKDLLTAGLSTSQTVKVTSRSWSTIDKVKKAKDFKSYQRLVRQGTERLRKYEQAKQQRWVGLAPSDVAELASFSNEAPIPIEAAAYPQLQPVTRSHLSQNEVKHIKKLFGLGFTYKQIKKISGRSLTAIRKVKQGSYVSTSTDIPVAHSVELPPAISTATKVEVVGLEQSIDRLTQAVYQLIAVLNGIQQTDKPNKATPYGTYWQK